MLQHDIKLLLQHLVIALDKIPKRETLKHLNNEELLLKFFETKKNQNHLDKLFTSLQFPVDNIKSCKDIAYSVNRIYDDYSIVFNGNFKEIKSIIGDTRNVSSGVNQSRVNKTIKDLESRYIGRKNMDTYNLRLKTLFERLEAISQ